jgi:hypothetical protein
MRAAALLLLVSTAAACGGSLRDPAAPDTTTTLPEWTEADCMMFNPTACRLDVGKISVGIDVHYPNAFFCQLQILPSAPLPTVNAYNRIASSWQVTMGYAATDQTVIAPEMSHDGVLEYDLGTEALYLTRVTFSSIIYGTLADLVAGATGHSDISLYAVPVACPGQQ